MDFFLPGNRLDKQIADRRRIQNPHEEQVHGTVPCRTVVMQNMISQLTVSLRSTTHHRKSAVHNTSKCFSLVQQKELLPNTKPKKSYLYSLKSVGTSTFVHVTKHSSTLPKCLILFIITEQIFSTGVPRDFK